MSAPRYTLRAGDPEDIALRVRCIELALGHPNGDPLSAARTYYAFATGAEDASPRDRILQAMEDAGVS
jgi:hypothetical protein